MQTFLQQLFVPIRATRVREDPHQADTEQKQSAQLGRVAQGKKKTKDEARHQHLSETVLHMNFPRREKTYTIHNADRYRLINVRKNELFK